MDIRAFRALHQKIGNSYRRAYEFALLVVRPKEHLGVVNIDGFGFDNPKMNPEPVVPQFDQFSIFRAKGFGAVRVGHWFSVAGELS